MDPLFIYKNSKTDVVIRRVATRQHEINGGWRKSPKTPRNLTIKKFLYHDNVQIRIIICFPLCISNEGRMKMIINDSLAAILLHAIICALSHVIDSITDCYLLALLFS